MASHKTIDTQAKLATKSGIGQSTISRIIRAATPATAETIDAIARALGVSHATLMTPNTNHTSTTAVGKHQIPLISYVQAGCWTESSQSGGSSDWLLTELDLSDDIFALEIKGNSMLPDFRPGDRVIIDASIAPNPGDFVVAKNEQHETTFKKYRSRGANEQGQTVFELVPLNEDYPSMHSDLMHIQIIGTMVEHRRYRK